MNTYNYQSRFFNPILNDLNNTFIVISERGPVLVILQKALLGIDDGTVLTPLFRLDRHSEKKLDKQEVAY